MDKTKFYGEHLTDKTIREVFYPDYDYKGVMIEIGAAEPVELSLSKHFRDNGWRCICIDANPNFCKKHEELGHEIYNYACSKESLPEESSFYINRSPMSHSSLGMKYGGDWESEIKIKVITLNDLLKSINVDRIDFACIDVEGWEIEVLKGFDLDKYQPKVLVIENLSNNAEYGKYMTENGYDFHSKCVHNEIYVRR